MESEEMGRDDDRELVSLLDALVPRYLRELRSAIAATEGNDRLTMPQFRCLQAIAATGTTGATTSRLAEATNVTVPTMSAMIDGLVGRALVERQSDPESRRRVLLFATEHGVKLLNRYQATMNRRHLAIISGLEGDQKARLQQSVAALLDQLDRLGTESGEAGAD